jgi:LPXTG-motif cell wall-anchored protein
MTPRATLVSVRVISTGLVAASVYCALWFLSSSDLAFLQCQGHFSLFADTFRCRQPYIAAILGGLLLLSATALLLMFRRRRL